MNTLIDPTNPIPLYHQISGLLRRRIEDGDYAIGSLLPPEEELCGEFQVSRATIRAAVGELVAEDIVNRRRGVGTLILKTGAQPRGQQFRGSLSDLMGEMRRAGVSDITVTRQTSIPPRIAVILELAQPLGTVIRRTRTMGGKVFNRTINYMADSYGDRLTRKELERESLMWLLSSKGVKLVEAIQSVKAEAADRETSRDLGLPLGAPVLFVERVVYGKRHAPIELVQTWYRGDMYEYTVTFSLSGREQDDVHARLA